MKYFLVAILSICAYLIGSISFAYIIVKKAKGIDIREVGSGNAGTTNVYRTAGWKIALVVLFLDIFKGFIVTVISSYLIHIYIGKYVGILVCFVSLFVMLGHILPLYTNFRGGKAVATGIGILIAINPLVALILFIFAVVIIFITRIMSIASISCAVLSPILILLLDRSRLIAGNKWEYFAGLLIFACVIVFMHRENLKRLREGTENKLSFKTEKE